MTYPQFPATFRFGAATAAYQIEGSWSRDGKGLSIWDVFVRRAGKIRNGDTGDFASDHYRRYETDLAIMKMLNLDTYRFSISWPRIFPAGKGPLNQKGLDFYDRLVDRLCAFGIEPFVTLFHWDLPQDLQTEMGGFESRDCAAYFADYAETVVQRLGDRVKHWMTLNEPMVYASQGHLLGVHAPGRRSPRAWLRALHHQLLGHGQARAAIKTIDPSAQVGLTLSLWPVSPRTDSHRDQQAARLGEQLFVRMCLTPLFHGHYPEPLWKRLWFLRPPVHPTDLETIAQPIDFVGVNNYSKTLVHYLWYVPLLQLSSSLLKIPLAEFMDDGIQYTSMGWEVYPEGMYQILMQITEEYNAPAIYITENGAAFTDIVQDGRVKDPLRRAFLEAYLQAVLSAMNNGARVKGYFVWSLLDNFEWALGYEKRFGIVHVDYQTQQRIIKDSGFWYRDVIRNQTSRNESKSA